MTYDYSSRPAQSRWRPLHNRQSLRRLRDPRATILHVAVRVIAVSFVAVLAYVLVSGTRPWLERVAAPAAAVTPFTRLAPAVARQPTKTATATAVALLVFVPTVVPTLTLPPPATAVPPTATEGASAVPPTVTQGAPGVLPTITPLVMATQTAATAAPTPVPATATPEPPSTPGGVIVHTVERGESIWSIAAKYGVRREALLEANRDRIDNPASIRAGIELLIPALGTGPPTQ